MCSNSAWRGHHKRLELKSALCLCRTTSALGFHPFVTALAQLAGTYAIGVLVVLSAYAGYTVTASILEVRGSTAPCTPNLSQSSCSCSPHWQLCRKIPEL